MAWCPLLFAAQGKQDRNDFARLVKLVAVVLFCDGVISGRNTNALEPVFHGSAEALLDGTVNGPAGVFGLLKTVYVDDERFTEDVARFAVNSRDQGCKLTRYILARLESDASGLACDPETNPATVEHVLPENPSAACSCVSRFACQSSYTSSKLTFRISCRNFARLKEVFIPHLKTGQITCYKTGQFICS